MEYHGKIFEMSKTDDELVEKRNGIIDLFNLSNQGSDFIKKTLG